MIILTQIADSVIEREKIPPFSEEAYQGEFNINQAHKRLILLALATSPTFKVAFKRLGVTRRSLIRLLKRHNITDIEIINFRSTYYEELNQRHRNECHQRKPKKVNVSRPDNKGGW